MDKKKQILKWIRRRHEKIGKWKRRNQKKNWKMDKKNGKMEEIAPRENLENG